MLFCYYLLCAAFSPTVTGTIRRIGVSDFELISAELVVGVGTIAKRRVAVDGACEDSTTTCGVLADVCSEVFVMLFNLLPLRDGAAASVVEIFIEPDPCPGDLPVSINDAEAVGVAEGLVSCAIFAPSFGTHCIEKPI